MQRRSKYLLVILALSTLAAGAMLLWPSSAAAQSGTPGQRGELADSWLETMLQREQLALQSLELRLELSAEVRTTADAWIAALQAEGRDTAVLEDALAAYETGVATATAHADSAAARLDAHAGFDADGNVSDRAQARETVRAAGGDLRLGNRTLTDATRALRTAIIAYRQANR